MTELLRRLRWIAAATLLAACNVPTALAATPADKPAVGPSEPGCARRGAVDLNKLADRGEKMFAIVDTDANGTITEVEFMAAEPPRAHRGHRMHPPMGTPHDGPSGDPAQRQAMETAVFKALDTDGNGQLSSAEFSQLHQVMQTTMRKQAFARLDSNGDGTLDKSEFPPMAKRMAAMDSNGDGTVTRQEMHAAKQAGKQPAAPPQPAN